MNISALVVVYNEDERLEECLDSLLPCEEIVVVDLGSSDNSVAIANKYADQVLFYKKVPFVEQVLPKVVPYLKNKWVLHIDPDEVMEKQLFFAVQEISKSNIAVIELPWQFYFLGERLDTTIWGGIKYKKMLFNKNFVDFVPILHKKINIKEGVSTKVRSTSVVRHYWIDSYQELLSKHRRYLLYEGRSRFEEGAKYSILSQLKESFKGLLKSLIIKRGILGKKKGVFLSFFYFWYLWQAHNSLKRYERGLKKS